MKLVDRCAIITGASHGLGAAIARHYAAAGAHLLLCGRDLNALETIQHAIAQYARPDQQILIQATDVAVPKQVDALIDRAISTWSRLDTVVNNAGIHGPKGVLEEADWSEWVHAIEVNLLGAVSMCRAALPHMKRARSGKIINISGGGATKPMPGLSAYAASKAALVRFTETLAEEVRADGIDVNAVAPGVLNTRLLQEIVEAGPEKVGADYYAQIVKAIESGGTPLDKAASLCGFLASQESNGITGKLISAVWDPWQDFAQHHMDLNTTDIYTLRRIVPSDRGKTWGS